MNNQKRGFLLLAFVFLLLLPACGKEKKENEENQYKIHYVNHDETAVLSYDYPVSQTEPEKILEELLAQLSTMPEKLEYHAPLAGEFALKNYTLLEGQLMLDFDEAYKNQAIIKEILVRAAIVRTLTQVEGVEQVSFSVNGEPLMDASGQVVGMMKADSFVDNAGNEINTYEKVKLRLYFANAEGTRLIPVSRSIVYNSNFSLERQVVEEIIAGPKESETGLKESGEVYPVINPSTKIISVNVRDGICYVNLDGGFLNPVYQVTPETVIYSLVNSLIEIGNVNKVQISVNGETAVSYQESISLSTMFERNLDLVE